MTCIAGIEHDGKVWLAGDSAAESETVKGFSRAPKVWVRDGLAWGGAGCLRPLDLVRYSLRVEKPPPRGDCAAWVTCEVVPAIRQLFNDHELDSDVSEWGLLLGVRNELWEIDSDGFSASRGLEAYGAVGTAQTPALCVFAALRNRKLTPRNRLSMVVRACATHVPGVGGRVDVVST